jgi:hypothetical protein
MYMEAPGFRLGPRDVNAEPNRTKQSEQIDTREMTDELIKQSEHSSDGETMMTE